MKSRKKILIAPLDWGLGHATRCIPIIRELIKRNIDVVIASDHRPADLLKKEFPALTHVRFPGSPMHYNTEGKLHWTILRQLPAYLNNIRMERRYLNVLIKLHSIDAVISDSRFGAFSNTVPSVLVIHQLHILLPPPFAWGEKMVGRVNRFFCNRFSEVWVPDMPGEPNLAGKMSHPAVLPKHVHYIGALTGMSKIVAKKEIDILVILSGPEPQRSILEEKVVAQCKETNLVSVVVRGKPEHNTTMKLTPHLTMINSLQREDLSAMVAAAKVVVSRPGYSTVMDLSFVGANAIFIPTPQQTEQEYLARMLKEKKVCYSEEQNDFNLLRSLERAASYSGFSGSANDLSKLQERIDHCIGA